MSTKHTNHHWLIITLAVTLAIVLGTTLALRSSIRAGFDGPADETGVTNSTTGSDVTIVSLDGTQTFTVPEPGDPEWADYQEMLGHRQFRSVLRGSEGHGLPYDPEWRALIEGRRQAVAVDMPFTGGTRSLESLGQAVLDAMRDTDRDRLKELRLTAEEFETIFWPEFPQSRPYVRIPVEEAWGFHLAHCLGGSSRAVQLHGGRALELVEVRHGAVKDYTNFVLYEDVILRAVDRDGHDEIDLAVVPTIAKRKGQEQYKVFIYRD